MKKYAAILLATSLSNCKYPTQASDSKSLKTYSPQKELTLSDTDSAPTESLTEESTTSLTTASKSSERPPPRAPRPNYPVAKPVLGKPGKVYSPFDGSIVDVRGVPSGELVRNPNDPPELKQFFHTP